MNPELMLLVSHISTEKLKKMAIVINNELSSRENLIKNIETKLTRKYILITGLANITGPHVEGILDMFSRFGDCRLADLSDSSIRIKFDDLNDLNDAYEEITPECIATLFRNDF
uniref:RRM domain-containing protein n=1 Tax=viral metagenome TaxID=1070528 RepID=A0A6C0C8T2_9ZZZZ